MYDYRQIRAVFPVCPTIGKQSSLVDSEPTPNSAVRSIE